MTKPRLLSSSQYKDSDRYVSLLGGKFLFWELEHGSEITVESPSVWREA